MSGFIRVVQHSLLASRVERTAHSLRQSAVAISQNIAQLAANGGPIWIDQEEANFDLCRALAKTTEVVKFIHTLLHLLASERRLLSKLLPKAGC
jgi:hypothetical protein